MIRLILFIVIALVAVATLSTLVGPARGWLTDPSPAGRRRLIAFVGVPTVLVILGFLALGLFLDPGSAPNSVYVPPTMNDQGEVVPGHHETIEE